MHDGCLGWPADDDHGRCLVGFDEFDGDGVGCGDGTASQFVILDMESRFQLSGIPAPSGGPTPGGALN
jgi:hypothetical protein